MAKKTNNAGKYNKTIRIYGITNGTDSAGFPAPVETLILTCKADIKTTKGMTLIANDSDFEKAYTRFLIRYPVTEIKRKMIVRYRSKDYDIEYVNNVDEESRELELQCKEVMADG